MKLLCKKHEVLKRWRTIVNEGKATLRCDVENGDAKYVADTIRMGINARTDSPYEQTIIDAIREMGEQSLSPDTFDKLEDALREIAKNRSVNLGVGSGI